MIAPGTISIDEPSQRVGFAFANYLATTAPATSDDETAGYWYNSIWCDQITGKVYICTDPTTSAAVWRHINKSGAVADGGTGLTSYTIGDLLYASGTTTLSKLTDVATGNALIAGGVGAAPSWGKIGLTTHISGTLPYANGGTGLTALGTGLQVLRTNAGATAMEWATLTAGDVTKVGTPVNNQIGVWTGDGTIEGDPNLTFDGALVLTNGNLEVTKTTEQLRLSYNSTNYFKSTVDANANTTFDLVAASGTPAFTFSKNVGIGGKAARSTTEGTNRFDIYDGTAPVGTLTNGISLYSTAGELRVMDAAGNATLLSPHDTNDNSWIYDSVDLKGKRLKIDVEKLLRKINDHFGWDFIHDD